MKWVDDLRDLFQERHQGIREAFAKHKIDGVYLSRRTVESDWFFLSDSPNSVSGCVLHYSDRFRDAFRMEIMAVGGVMTLFLQMKRVLFFFLLSFGMREFSWRSCVTSICMPRIQNDTKTFWWKRLIYLIDLFPLNVVSKSVFLLCVGRKSLSSS